MLKPIAEYTFIKSPTLTTRYFLESHTGEEIPHLLQNHKRELEQDPYIVFRRQDDVNGRQRGKYKWILERAKSQCYAGFNFSVDEPNKSSSNNSNPFCKPFRQDAILLEFSDTWEQMKLYFFKDQAKQYRAIFKQWLEGDLILE